MKIGLHLKPFYWHSEVQHTQQNHHDDKGKTRRKKRPLEKAEENNPDTATYSVTVSGIP